MLPCVILEEIGATQADPWIECRLSSLAADTFLLNSGRSTTVHNHYSFVSPLTHHQIYKSHAGTIRLMRLQFAFINTYVGRLRSTRCHPRSNVILKLLHSISSSTSIYAGLDHRPLMMAGKSISLGSRIKVGRVPVCSIPYCKLKDQTLVGQWVEHATDSSWSVLDVWQ